MKEPVINSDKAGRTACPPGANSALWTSFLYTRDMSKPPCCSCGKVDSRRGCGGIWWKWSCVFKGLEMDKFPFGWGRGTPES